MKADLTSSIVAAIAGIIIAFFVTNFLTPEIQDVSFRTLDESVSSDLTDPNPELFNYRSVNPTVEVFVGQCTKYNEKGECIDDELVEEETPVEEENDDTN